MGGKTIAAHWTSRACERVTAPLDGWLREGETPQLCWGQGRCGEPFLYGCSKTKSDSEARTSRLVYSNCKVELGGTPAPRITLLP